MSQRLQQQYRALGRALKRLEDPQGMVARRNARGATLEALGQIRKELDAAYPVIRRKAKAKAKASNRPADRERRWRRQGWMPLGEPMAADHIEAVTKAARAGIKVRTLRGCTWVPDWYCKHWRQPLTVLERMRKSAPYRKAFEIEQALSQQPQ